MPKRKASRIGGRNWKRVFALTGGFGSGKSTVLDLFRKKGAFCLDADVMVKNIFKTRKFQSSIRRRFGSELFVGSRLNKKKLAAMVFNSLSERKKLEKMVHPQVRKNMVLQLKKKKGNIAICDIPLLFEAGWNAKFDGVIVVDVPLKLRIKRLQKRGFSIPEINQRMRAQWPLKKKVMKADFIVRNNGKKTKLKKQVNQLWKNLIREEE